MSKNKKEEKEEKQIVATHRKARQYYEIMEVFEAGLCLVGPEVKSLRKGHASLDGCFGRHEGGELFLFNFYIPPYQFNTSTDPLDPRRTRKLLMRRGDIGRIGRSLQTKGLTLIPLEVYFRKGWAKVALALARGKSGPDRRDDLKKKALAREAEKSFKGKYRG
ncbi:MAG TPA: SsrA-binding protein [Elusimicrobia bacterium]|nr:SsrA-binding protein [Elusimicrobiota bacterium]HBT61966.1 SsrA-binding protein [Elusimicrobiota bacterium]